MPAAAPNPYFKPVIVGASPYADRVLLLNPNFFYELRSGALGVNSSTRSGAPDAVATDVSETTGFIDGAGDFNLTTAALVTPSHSTNNDLTLNGDFLTLEMVVKFPAALPGADGIMISKGQDAGTDIGWFLEYTTSGNLHMYIFTDSNWLRFISASAMPRDVWIHVVVGSHASNITANEKVWLNGVPQSTIHSSTFSGTAAPETFPLVIGGRYSDGNPPLNTPVDFILDSVVGYDFQLTDAQVLENAQASGLA